MERKQIKLSWANRDGKHQPFFVQIHPGRLTWNLQITHLERKMIFQTSMIMVHVNLPGCNAEASHFFELQVS